MQEKTFASVIKEARESIGISQRQLSVQSGVDHSTIAKIEKGLRNQPNVLIIRKLANLLYVDEVELLELAGYSPEDIELTLNSMSLDMIEYFKRSSLADIKLMIERLKEEQFGFLEMSRLMKEHGGPKAGNPGKTKKEKISHILDSRIAKTWQKTIDEYDSSAEQFGKYIDELNQTMELRLQNGEELGENSPNVHALINRFMDARI